MGIISPRHSDNEDFQANLSGTKFSFSAPKHNHPRIPASGVRRNDKNIYDASEFTQTPSDDAHEVFSTNLQFVDWTFWRRRFVLAVDSIAHVILDSKVYKFSEFNSLFNKTIFECAAERLIFAHGGSYASTGLCRLNWTAQEINGSEWISFDNDGRYSSKGLYSPCHSVIQTFYLTPISDEHMLSMCFTQVSRKEVAGLDEAFSKLREKVMSSTELYLSEDATSQKAAIEEKYPNQQYSNDLPPYEFELMDYPDEREISRNCTLEYGADEFIALPRSARFKMVDDLVKAEKEKRQQQIDSIMASHLRFKTK